MLWPDVGLSICVADITLKRLNKTNWFSAQRLSLAYRIGPTVLMEFGYSPKIKLLPSGTLSQTLNSAVVSDIAIFVLKGDATLQPT